MATIPLIRIKKVDGVLALLVLCHRGLVLVMAFSQIVN